MMQIRAFATGEITHRLEVAEAGLRQTEVRQAHRQPELLKQGQQLAMGLSCETVLTKTILEPELHQDTKADLLAMERTMGRRKLGEAVVNGMGRNRATAGATQATHHTGGERAGFGNANPGLS